MSPKHVPKTYLRHRKYMQNTYLGCVLYVILTRYVQVSDVFGNLLVRLRDVFGDHDTRPLWGVIITHPKHAFGTCLGRVWNMFRHPLETSPLKHDAPNISNRSVHIIITKIHNSSSLQWYAKLTSTHAKRQCYTFVPMSFFLSAIHNSNRNNYQIPFSHCGANSTMMI